MSRRQVAVFADKTPKQARAWNTREVIFEATARIIEQRCPLTTNTIAARAGISIGTLYGHFPNKEAVLVSMARHQLALDEAAVLQAICNETASGTSRARLAVSALLAQYRVRPAVRRAIMAAHTAQSLSQERSLVLHRAAQRISAWRAQAGRRQVDDTAMYVATRALAGTIRAAFEEESPLLDMPEFEDQLTALVDRCFAPVQR